MGGVLDAWLPKSILALRGYDRATFRHDLIAGITVGLVALPLAMAFAIASGLTPQAGIYCAIVTGFIISALGGSRVQIGGPTGAFVVVVSGIVAEHGVAGLFMCTMMAGVMLVILGVTGTGTAVRFIPRPVVVGFTNGIAVLIASTQIRDFLGLQMTENPGEFLGRLAAIGRHLDTITPAALGLGVMTLLLVLGTNRFVKVIPGTVVGAGRRHRRRLGGPAAGGDRGVALRRRAGRLARVSHSGVSTVAHPRAALAGAHRRDARCDRVADVGGGRRSHERRSAQSERRARRSGRRQHRVADVRRVAGDGRHCPHGD